MSREILFRGKQLNNGEWAYGFFVGSVYGAKPIIVTSTTMEDDCGLTLEYHHVNPVTVGQYTGLTDKNGAKIFEGDIVEHHVQGLVLVNRGVVKWDDGNGRWAYRLNTMSPSFYMHKPIATEVIGNIHDNPELLST